MRFRDKTTHTPIGGPACRHGITIGEPADTTGMMTGGSEA